MVLRILVDDGAVLQVTEVEHAHRAVGSDRREHVTASTGTAEGDVVDLCEHTHTHTGVTLNLYIVVHINIQYQLSWPENHHDKEGSAPPLCRGR